MVYQPLHAHLLAANRRDVHHWLLTVRPKRRNDPKETARVAPVFFRQVGDVEATLLL